MTTSLSTTTSTTTTTTTSAPVKKMSKLATFTQNTFVLRCALFAAMGGFLFGYDQGVISITLVMPHFNNTFPLISTKL